MKQLNKIIFSFTIFMTCLFVNANFVSAATLNVRSLLKNGSTGEQVKLLQTELNKVMNCGLTVDGAFGAKTKTCVQNFQKKYGLTVDGIAGSATAGKLNTTYLASNNYVVVNVSSDTNSGYLNIRAKATTNSTKLGKVSYGTVFKLYGSTVTSGTTWYKIKYNGKDAYISSTYTTKNAIVVDISEQLLKFYKNGKLTLEAPVITGNNGNNGTEAHKTPTGRYTLKTSEKYLNATLMNDSPVDYWMRYYPARGIGFHDADAWRSNSEFYDVNRYKTNGSHGCVNMLDADAKALYNATTSNILVFVVA